ncbi:MAG: hypothetical protein FWF66_04345 [Candidatus Bathyarchaeota archaeon]|nr:hypothetical protein [Candidatus Termiticorpusculum sp.]MCL1970669.1 hypothetical protein [Candidatus Termiticorpusculum sp.]
MFPPKIYVISGGSNIFFYPIGYIAVYDPFSGTLEQGKNDPIPRANSGITVLDDILYVIGGELLGTDGQRETSAVNEQYIPIGYEPEYEPYDNQALPTVTTTVTYEDNSPSDTYESKLSWTLLTGYTVAITILIIGVIVLTLFFCLKGKQKKQDGLA